MSLVKLYGRRAVLEALRSGASRVEKVILAKGGHGAVLAELSREAEARGVMVEILERRRFEKLAGEVVHQGVLAMMQARSTLSLEDLLQAAKADPAKALLVVTDEIEDPRNLGAIARCAEGAGATGLVITAHRSAEFTPAAEKASGGAVEYLSVAKVTNLANAFEDMKAAGLWIVGLDASAGQEVWEADLKRPLALVIGGEGKGLRRLTRERCDFLIRLPMHGRVASLNASVAAGITLYEVLRQRRPSPAAPLASTI
jgi:23S rRNA (guanosine2251-2'-O)-methyltransferase